MKKIQRGFTVEYKSGRRKLDPKSNSIWAGMDLTSIARHLHDEALPSPPPFEHQRGADVTIPTTTEDQAEPLLTLTVGQHTNALAIQEANMADDNDTINISNSPAPVDALTPAPKKERKPRARKALAEAAPAAVAAEVADASGVSSGKRGKQIRRRNSARSAEAITPKSAPVKRGPKPAQKAKQAPASAIDEMSDLLQLESENQKLRKLLSDKLRAENADLRKRLKLD